MDPPPGTPEQRLPWPPDTWEMQDRLLDVFVEEDHALRIARRGGWTAKQQKTITRPTHWRAASDKP
jgi:hypothetical protein